MASQILSKYLVELQGGARERTLWRAQQVIGIAQGPIPPFKKRKRDQESVERNEFVVHSEQEGETLRRLLDVAFHRALHVARLVS